MNSADKLGDYLMGKSSEINQFNLFNLLIFAMKTGI